MENTLNDKKMLQIAHISVKTEQHEKILIDKSDLSEKPSHATFPLRDDDVRGGWQITGRISVFQYIPCLIRQLSVDSLRNNNLDPQIACWYLIRSSARL
jgi:hypothetical protein